MPTVNAQNRKHPLVVPFDFDGEGQLAIHRDFWRLPISISAKSFYLVMLSQEDKSMAELRSVGLDPHNVRGWEHV